MANKKHTDILKNSCVKEWNIWRENNLNELPDLSGEDLSCMNLERINLSGADLSNVNFSNSNLRGANLGACFVPNRQGQLAFWRSCWLEEASLEKADLTQTVFIAYCDKTIFTKALCNYTRFVNIECLDGAIGLDDIVITAKNSRCSIGVDTILKSKGALPVQFLKKCGYIPSVQDVLYKLEFSLPEGSKMIEKREELQSVFISCVEEDINFAKKLQKHFQDLKVDNWFYKINLLPGQRPQDMIDTGIQERDRLILIVSKNMFSDDEFRFFKRNSVRKEILRAREKEHALRKKSLKSYRVIFPIMLDNAFIESANDEIMLLRDDTWAVGFNEKSDTQSFKKDFTKLLDGLDIYKIQKAIGS